MHVILTYWSSATLSCMLSAVFSISADASLQSSLLSVRSLIARTMSSRLFTVAECRSYGQKKQKQNQNKKNNTDVTVKPVPFIVFKAKDYLAR